MSSDDTSAGRPARGGRRGWRRRFLIALLLASPSIGSWLSANVIYRLLDEWQQPVKTEMANLETEISDLDRFVTRFQANELGRGTLNLLMSAVAADMQLRYLGDNLYRANSASIGSLRRAAAIVYPERWQDTLKPYEEIVRQRYESPEIVQRLQDFENTVIEDSLSKIVRNQQRINVLAETNDRYERLRRFITSTFTYLAMALSIVLFIFELKSTDPENV